MSEFEFSVHTGKAAYRGGVQRLHFSTVVQPGTLADPLTQVLRGGARVKTSPYLSRANSGRMVARAASNG